MCQHVRLVHRRSQREIVEEMEIVGDAFIPPGCFGQKISERNKTAFVKNIAVKLVDGVVENLGWTFAVSIITLAVWLVS